MMTVLAVLTTVTLILTVAGTLAGRGRTMTAAWVAPLYGGLVLVVIALAGYVVHSQRERDYERCWDTRTNALQYAAGLNGQLVQLYDVIDAATGTTHYTSDLLIPGRGSLRAGLDSAMRALDDPNDCPKP